MACPSAILPATESEQSLCHFAKLKSAAAALYRPWIAIATTRYGVTGAAQNIQRPSFAAHHALTSPHEETAVHPKCIKVQTVRRY